MSYAIIRNVKYKRENLKGIYRHNERKNYNYSNRNIDKEKAYLNYAIKEPIYSYEKEFDRIKEKYDLKGQIKTVSNIACEYIITSDKEFFEEIGEEETKRYFKTAYQFVSKYKNLGEKYIMSAQVHMDEETPHMHLVFLPVVHTTDRKGNNIDKLACSEFWKEKDSYRQLQNAFHKYMVDHNFQLERGVAVEETGRKHINLKEYKDITNFEKTKEKLQNIKLELPDVPNLEDINVMRFSKKRDEKIIEEIIKPKDNLINDLYQDNLILQQELSKQARIVEKAEKYERERQDIIADNKDMHNQLDEIKSAYSKKERDLEWTYKHKINRLENENNYLKNVIDRFKDTIHIFVHWVCKKFDLGAEDYLIRDFQKENHILIDAEKQIQKEEKQKEWDLER